MNDAEPSHLGLTDAERAAFADLPRSAAIPDGLEERVVRALDGAGERSIATRPPAFRRALALAAAAILILALGFALGRRPAAAPALRAGDRYLLLLRETAAFNPPEPRSALVGEYGAWARGLARQGVLELGEELADDGSLLDTTATDAPVPTAAGVVAGLFIVHADSYADALALARTCPHLRHGGQIELRRIQQTG